MSLTRKVAVNTSALAAGRVVTAVAGVLSVAISTRYLGLDTYGALVTAVALVAVIGALADVGISAIGAREIAKHRDQTERLLGGTLTATLMLTGPAALIGALAAFIAYSGPGEELQRTGVLVLIAPMPITALAAAYGAWFVAEQRAYLGTVSSIGAAVIQLAILLVVVALDLGYVGVVAAYASQALASSAISVAIGTRHVRIRPWLNLRLGWRLLVWAAPLGFNKLVAVLYARFDILMLSLMASARAVALYGLAFKLIDFLTLIPNYATITLLPEFAKLADLRERFTRVLSAAMSVMETAALGLVAFFMVFADEAVQVVGGSKFEDSADLLRILVLGAGLAYVTNVIAQALIAVNEQKRLVILSLVGFPVNAVVNVALIPVLGASGAAIAFVAAELLDVVLLVGIYKRAGRTFPMPERVPQRLIAACLAASVGLIKVIPVEGLAVAWLTLAVGGLGFLVVYGGSLYLLRAMPPVVHQNLVRPVWGRVRGSLRTATVKAH
ncbi:MAG TPA: flippase [Thermoleophilaceae bacterium]|jgi:O-antigen/teichoic acid export membrane protein